MVATAEQLEIIRTALAEYVRLLRDQCRYSCSGYSEAGIDLCVRRMQVEDILWTLSQR